MPGICPAGTALRRIEPQLREKASDIGPRRGEHADKFAKNAVTGTGHAAPIFRRRDRRGDCRGGVLRPALRLFTIAYRGGPFIAKERDLCLQTGVCGLCPPQRGLLPGGKPCGRCLSILATAGSAPRAR